MSDRKLKVGVIGVGAMGSGHLAMYEKNPRCEVVAICDKDEKWLEYCKREHDIRYGFLRPEEIVACEEVEAVSVCLPTVFHAPVTLAALESGKHVLCEKPPAMSAHEAQKMVDAAERSGKTFMFSFNQRLGADIQYLKRTIDEGHLGEVYHVHTTWLRPMGMLPVLMHDRVTGPYNRNWFCEKAMGGGVALDLGSHVTDLALYLMGFPKLKQVTGRAYSKFGPVRAAQNGTIFDVEDHAVGFAEFENGASLQVEVSFGSYVERELVAQSIFGDKGGAYREIGAPLKLFSQESGAYTTVTPRLDSPYTPPMDYFVECVLDGKKPLIQPQEGVAVMQVLDGIRQGAAK